MERWYFEMAELLMSLRVYLTYLHDNIIYLNIFITYRDEQIDLILILETAALNIKKSIPKSIPFWIFQLVVSKKGQLKH